MRFFKKILLISIALFNFNHYVLAQIACEGMFTLPALSPEQQARLNPYLRLKERSRGIARVFSEDLVRQLVVEEECPLAQERFALLINNIGSAIRENKKISGLKKIIADSLVNRVPANQIEKRISSYFKSPSYRTLLQMLGEISLDDLKILVHGGNHLSPTPESLLGQYIARTGSVTLSKRFRKGPQTQETNSEKLVVAISQESWPVYQELFGSPNFLIHVHTPYQGTLAIAHNKKYGSYANLSSEMRMPQLGTLMPHILLSTAEGERMELFKMLGKTSDNLLAQYPWTLVDKEGQNYCAKGGYNSCTHWVGNIPIGEKRVDAYSFPGRIDIYAGNLDSTHDASPKTKPLVAHNHASRLAQLVWKAPGHEQLADVIGLRDQNLAGELANPGYVIFSLVGQTTADRVPVVFLATQNHQTSIDPNLEASIRAY
ncbi:MAG: hypothetical protein A4S09_03265 [Proteobacteria bacterium SG_bin7]|nr:MAG: hypothetical protein A4S09_03265 [Proteobacteria bacterium SG_bin7]